MVDNKAKIAELLKDDDKLAASVGNALKMMDKDKSGFLEEAELVRFVKKMNDYLIEELEVDEAKVGDFMKAYDKDGNNKIDIKELTLFYKAYWADKLE